MNPDSLAFWLRDSGMWLLCEPYFSHLDMGVLVAFSVMCLEWENRQ